jgi:AcrR family transcriptional regulator
VGAKLLREKVKVAKTKICTEKPTVNKIIEAAIPLFATKGVAAVSVKDVADAAGVNIALISYYFGGKDNLYSFVLENQLAVMGDAIDGIICHEELSPIMKIRRFADTLVEIYKTNPYIDRLFFTELMNPTKCFDSIIESATFRLHRFLRDCISEAISNGEFRSDIEPNFAAMSLIRMLNLAFMSRHFCKELLPNKEGIAERYVAQAVEIYLRGVLK